MDPTLGDVEWISAHLIGPSPTNAQAFVHFDCAAPRSWSYSLPALNHGMKALSVAKETYLRINEEGIMCVQHQVENTVSGQSTFIDFLCLAEEEDEEPRDDDEEEDEELELEREQQQQEAEA